MKGNEKKYDRKNDDAGELTKRRKNRK